MIVKVIGCLAMVCFAGCGPAANQGVPPARMANSPEIDDFSRLDNLHQLVADGRVATTLPAIKEYTRQYPRSVTGWKLLALAHRELGELAEALQCYDTALEQDERDTAALIGKGLVARQLGEIDVARRAYLQAIEIEPRSADAYTSLSVLELIERNYDQAVFFAEKAWALDQTTPTIPANLAIAYHYAGNTEQRDAYFTKAQELGYDKAEQVLQLFSGELTIHADEQVEADTRETQTLAEARAGFETRRYPTEPDKQPPGNPPAELFQVVEYPAQPGMLAAYLTPDPGDGQQHPAIIWITGGDCNTIGDVWSKRPQDNEQSASSYREAGLVMMFPSLRGGNTNPGVRESYFGEVDDVLAAAEFLAKLPYIDPERIYLGGHSTGGTLALLVAETSSRFRATFAFGPVARAADYGATFSDFDIAVKRERDLRAPIRWLHGIQSPVLVLEGGEDGNVEDLLEMQEATDNPQIHFHKIAAANHFDVLAPTNRLIAQRILLDTGPECAIAFTDEELNANFAQAK